MYFVLFAWFAWVELLAGIAKMQQAKRAMSTKHLVNWKWTVSKYVGINLVFQTDILLIVVIINNKRTSGINRETSAFAESVCYH